MLSLLSRCLLLLFVVGNVVVAVVRLLLLNEVKTSNINNLVSKPVADGYHFSRQNDASRVRTT